MVKKKRPTQPQIVPVSEIATADAIIEQARLAIEADRVKIPAGCVICGEESAPISAEGLCWVCRRLKLSAWRDSDTQMTAQE
jgi:Zn finger protein HypA/HybF involved in hydrogenase expression